ncbi:MAG TPA: N-acetylmuramoyl-L-alanine amidase [Pyrinomonadaceae bacterium]|nr:N-acetylmuramoyl-L-alanine amidase [Pyrinomonadaceae bacterium]
MAFQLTWLAEVLTRAGQKISEIDGWQSRGRSDMGRVFGVICHHTAGRREENMPSLKVILNGRPGINGPLANLGLARDGTWIIIAAGRANHAGKGRFRGIVNGNSNFIGIEAENTGLANDRPWPSVQMEAYHRGVAAMLTHVRQSPEFCIGHREWAPGRKPDPEFGGTLNMDRFRERVAAFMNGAAPPVLIPPVENPQGAATGGDPGRPTLRRGMSGDLTRRLQAKLGLPADGNFGPKTEAAVRRFQRDKGMVPDGIVGPKTWAKIGPV